MRLNLNLVGRLHLSAPLKPRRTTANAGHLRSLQKNPNSSSPSPLPPSSSSSLAFWNSASLSVYVSFSLHGLLQLLCHHVLLILCNPCNPFLRRSRPEIHLPNLQCYILRILDIGGVFLTSPSGTFATAIFNPNYHQTNFYLCVLHVPSSTIIWSANRDAPISKDGVISFSPQGITIYDQTSDGTTARKWSTPPLNSSATVMLLTDTGNLALLDHYNRSIWQSFDYATDTIVIGQKLPVGSSLVNAFSDSDLSSGNYQFSVASYDGLLQWEGMTYWKMSMETTAYESSNAPISFMIVTETGLYLLAGNGSVVAIEVVLPMADFRIAKLDSGGQFSVSSYSAGIWTQEFKAPDDNCRVPDVCGSFGLCTSASGSAQCICSCPSEFHSINQNVSQGCVPSNSSYSLPSVCNSNSSSTVPIAQSNSSSVSFTSLGDDVTYFQTATFSNPAIKFVNLSYCQSLCVKNCSCLGVFYSNTTGSCFLVEDQFASLMSSQSDSDPTGYVKMMVKSSTNQSSQGFPLIALVLLPSRGFFLFVTVLLLCMV